jgi:hypothetical protein
MAERDFVVKNGLQVNGGTWVVNTTGLFYGGSQRANTTHYFNSNVAITSNTSNTANNASFLDGVAASAYVNTTGNYTVSGNLNFTGTNTYFTAGWNIGANVIANTSAINFGNNSVNAIVNSTGLYVNGSAFQSSGGYYKGNAGVVGETSSKQNLYKINAKTQSNNITISADENAMTVGPITISDGFNLSIEEGGRAVII